MKSPATIAFTILALALCFGSASAQVPDWYPSNVVNAACAPITIQRVEFTPSARGSNSVGGTTIVTDNGKYVMMTGTKLRPGDKGAYCFPAHDHELNDTIYVMFFSKIVYLMRAISN
jgi:hypothetical protein